MVIIKKDVYREIAALKGFKQPEYRPRGSFNVYESHKFVTTLM